MSEIAIRRCLKKLLPYPPGKPIEEVQREYGLKRIYKLASNENPYGPSPKAIAAIKKYAAEFNYYPDGNVYILRNALAKKLRLKPEQFIFGNGSDELLLLIAMTYLTPRSNIVISKNAFVRYQMAADAMGAAVHNVPMKDWQVNVRAFPDSIDKNTKIVILGNPNNPIGCMAERADVEYLLERVPPDVLIVIDEAYNEYVKTRKYPNTLRYLKKYRNLILLRTFSKVYGLAGLRIGYGISNPDVISDIMRVRPPFNVNRAAQVAAAAALTDTAHINKTVAKTKEQKKYLYSELKRLGIKYVPSYTNFIFMDVGQAAGEVFEGLLRQGIIVRPMSGFGHKTCIRVTIGKPYENRAFVKALEKILSKKSKGV